MTIAFLNGDYLPLDEARISPLDRGFLFGDGIYEVIPVHGGKTIGFGLHYERMCGGLSAVEIELHWTLDKWRAVCSNLIDKNGGGNLTIYLQVTRGADSKRHHAYPVGVTPTVFGFASELVGSSDIKPLKICSAEEKRFDLERVLEGQTPRQGNRIRQVRCERTISSQAHALQKRSAEGLCPPDTHHLRCYVCDTLREAIIAKALQTRSDLLRSETLDGIVAGLPPADASFEPGLEILSAPPRPGREFDQGDAVPVR